MKNTYVVTLYPLGNSAPLILKFGDRYLDPSRFYDFFKFVKKRAADENTGNLLVVCRLGKGEKTQVVFKETICIKTYSLGKLYNFLTCEESR